jgi:hypothetical protein
MSGLTHHVARSLAICAVAALAEPAAAQEPTLATVLGRAGAYVAEFQRQFSGIVAEEGYAQEVKAVGRQSPCDALDMPVAMRACQDRLAYPRRSDLRSDLLLVKPAGAKDWLQFRDVFEVDGQPVRDRTERLTRLFLDPSPSSSNQIEAIREDSARYNIGDIVRNLNVPLFALSFLAPGHQARFKFTKTADRAPATAPASAPADGRGAPFHVSTEVWVVEYREVARDTIIHTNRNRDLPARGRFWIEPETGRVLMTELVARNRELRATIDVSYQSEPLLGLLVPIEMREWYDGLRTGSRIEAVARYGKFRQFQVNTNETFLIKK